jgi:hypothetical protein
MKNLIFILLALIVLLSGCNDDDDESSDSGTSNIVEITENITTVTTWYADSVYLIKKWDFWVRNTLTIEAGTVIKFTADGPGMSVASGGTVMAVGTSSNPIVFTSYKDDENGGDSNGDGTATAPNVKDWGIIWVEGNGSEFTYCHFFYGGSSSYPGTLHIYGVTATITHCTFVNNYGAKSGDFFYGALSADNADPAIVITNNIFYNNNLPLSIPCENSLDASNTFHNPDDPSEKNTMNGIFTYAYDEFTENTTWSETEVPYVINDNDLYIENALNLAEDVIIKFTPSSAFVKEVAATFSYNSSNIFTSFKDDSNGGDTNGDGDTSPTKGDWYGMEINDGFNTTICGTNILYADNCP